MPAAMESSQNIENPLEISIFPLNFFENVFFLGNLGKSPRISRICSEISPAGLGSSRPVTFLIKENRWVQSWISENPSDSGEGLETFVSKSENERERYHIEFGGVSVIKNFEGSATLVGEFAVNPLCRYNIYRQWDLRLFSRIFAERPDARPKR